MMKRTLVAACAVLAVVLSASVPPARAQIETDDLHIGLLLDFPDRSTDASSDLAYLQEEIHRVVGADKSVHFLPEHQRFTTRRADRMAADYEALAEEPEIDLIIAVGPASATTLAALGPLPKPTIAVGILDAELQKMPLADPGVSGVHNLTYVLSAGSIENDLASFHRIHPFSHLAVIISDDYEGTLEYQDFFERLAAPYGSGVELIFWGPESPLPELSEETDAVYVSMILGRQPGEIVPLAAELADRKLPSFARTRPYVDAGIMACIGNENGRDQIFRKLALIVEGIVLGEDLAGMPVRLNFDEQLVLNASTVERIGIDLSFETLFSARFTTAEEPAYDRILSLRDIVLEGLRSNLDLRIEQRNVDLAGEDIRRARSSLLPAIEVSTTLLQVDPDAAESALGRQPERTGSGVGTMQQIVYSEAAIANVKIQRYLADAARHQADLLALDVVLNLSRAYFDILLAKTARRIREEDLEASLRNLEIARTRNAVGYAGVADVYRWESEVARATQASIEAYNNLYLAKVQLNRLLDRADLDEDFDVMDVRLTDEIFGRFDPNRIGRLIENPRDLEILTEFLIQEAFRNMPSVKQLEANIRAAERQQQLNRRLYYLPTVALRAQADYTFLRGGKGVPQGPSAVPDATWNLGIHLTYPLFQGNQRRIAISQTAVQQQQLRLQEENLRQRLSEAVQVRVTNATSRRTNIHFARIAAESARKNFELVQDAYRTGQLEISQLIDAQRTAFSARQAETSAVYEYLVSFLQLENSIGVYTMLMTPEEQEAFAGRLAAFFSQRSSAR